VPRSLQVPLRRLLVHLEAGRVPMLRLIARFYDPQEGVVRLGGGDISGMDPEALLQKIAMVFQDVYLFQDTIGNNIRFGRTTASQLEVEEAALK